MVELQHLLTGMIRFKYGEVMYQKNLFKHYNESGLLAVVAVGGGRRFSVRVSGW